MAQATYLQNSFLGGEWSSYAQGRQDDPRYRTGMNVCRNVIPVEEGSATRRPGARMAAATRKGVLGVLRAFDFQQSYPYVLELTPLHMRFLSGGSLALESAAAQQVLSISTANPCEIITLHAHGWTTGDELIFSVDTGEAVNTTLAPLLGRELEITTTGTDRFTVKDAVTGETIDGSAIFLGATQAHVTRIADIVTTYTAGQLPTINTVQDDSRLVFLHGEVKPNVLTAVAPAVVGDFAAFSYAASDFLDGPYMDPPTDGTTITPSGTAGSVTLTLAGGATRFTPTTDIGRLVRLFSEPAAYNAGTTYAAGTSVKFNGNYYVSLVAGNVGKRPDADFASWGTDTTAAVWTWAQITAVADTTHATATIRGTALPRTTACSTWRLGLYSDTTGWPTCGVYHGGRFWLAGAQPNRLDSSKSNDVFNFAPTASDGSVADDNAISAVLAATDLNPIFWLVSDEKGIVCGTQAGEWVVRASELNDPLTPTSIDAKRVTQIGASNVPAVRTGMAICYVQRYAQKVIEYITTDNRGFSGRNLSIAAKHLTKSGIEELAYVTELVPVVWARTGDGQLLGCTYKRENPFASEPPEFGGWHHHDLGNPDLLVTSIQAGPSYGGTTDSLSFVVYNVSQDRYYTYILTDVFDQDNEITEAYFVDGGVSPSMASLVTVGGDQFIRLYSLWRLEGETVSVFLGGLDCGDFLVTDGQIDVPLNPTTVPLLTLSYLTGLTSDTNFRGIGMGFQTTPRGSASSPSLSSIQDIPLALPGGWASNYNHNEYAFDWDNGKLFAGSSTYGGIRKLDLTTYTEDLNVAGPAGALMMEYCNGYVYWAGVATLIRYKDDLSANTSAAMTTPQDMVSIPVGNTDYLLAGDLTTSDVFIFNLTTMTATAFTQAVNEHRAYVCRGPAYSGVALGYVLGWKNFDTNTLGAFGLYRVQIEPGALGGDFSMTRLGDIDATQVTGWHYFDTMVGLIFDETDGNLISHVETGSATAYAGGTTYAANRIVKSGGHDYKSLQAANTGNAPASSPTWWQDLGPSIASGTTAIIKIEAVSGRILWHVQSYGLPNYNGINQSRIRYGRYVFFGEDNQGGTTYILNDINTLTGVSVNTTFFNLFTLGGQAYNDFTGSLWMDCEYSYSMGDPHSPVPNGTTPSSWTAAFALLGGLAPFFPPADEPEAEVEIVTPVAVGYSYTSQGQILRPIAPDQSGTQTGPSQGKTRRAHWFTALLHKAQGIFFGTDFSRLYPGDFRSPGGTPYAANVLYSGVHEGTIQDDYTLDSMLCWEVTRPYPATVLTLGAMLQTQD